MESIYTNNKKALTLFDKAIYDQAQKKPEDAIIKLNKAIKLDTNFLEAYYMLAELLEKKNEKELAIKNYEKAFEIDSNFDVAISIKISINSYRVGDYNKAKQFMDYYIANSTERQKNSYNLEKIKEYIYFAYESYNNPVDFQPINLGEGVNTEFEEYWPSLSIDENTLVFTRLIPMRQNSKSTDPNDFQEDLFVSYRDIPTGNYQTAFPMPGIINTQLNEGAQCISGDGKICVITCCNRPEGKGSCDLYIMFNRNGRWTEPQNMKTVNTASWESNPSLSADAKTLYFASSRPGGFGKIDIWKININEKGIATSKAENLGNVINTDQNDVSPFIHPDGKTLYFSSDGHPGMGEQDIFFSKLDENNKWQKPVNIGYPINTKGEERSMIVNAKGNLAMYASTGNKNNLDIYKFDIPTKVQPTAVTYVKGYIYNKINQNRIPNALCELINLETNEKVISILSEEGNGEYFVALPVNNDYAFNVYKDGFLFYSENFSLKNHTNLSEPFHKNIPLSPIEEGLTVILKNIFFNFNSDELLPSSFVELGKLIEYLINNPKIKIEIGGHTDNIGNKEYNQQLSKRRAESVYKYLIDNGINKQRLTFAGYDFSIPIASNDTEEGRALNRRTEFKIISVN
jgi:outer membrane protein OmpA-like peptidoglycan-associated protein